MCWNGSLGAASASPSATSTPVLGRAPPPVARAPRSADLHGWEALVAASAPANATLMKEERESASIARARDDERQAWELLARVGKADFALLRRRAVGDERQARARRPKWGSRRRSPHCKARSYRSRGRRSTPPRRARRAGADRGDLGCPARRGLERGARGRPGVRGHAPRPDAKRLEFDLDPQAEAAWRSAPPALEARTSIAARRAPPSAR
jgi:hypothetical protein